MLMPSRSVNAVLLVSVIAAGCRRDRSLGEFDGARLVLMDTVLLAEKDTAFVGKASSLVVGPDRRYFIGDLFSKRVLVFDSAGRFDLGVGRAGHGPGELMAPTKLALDGDSLLYVIDNSSVELEVFDARSGVFRYQRTFPQRLSMLAVHGAHVIAGLPDPETRHSAVIIHGPDGPLPAIGPMPTLLDNPVVRNIFGTVEVATIGDTLVTAYEVSNFVYFTDISQRSVLDSVEFVPTLRHGARVDLLSRITPNDLSAVEAAVYKSSLPVELSLMGPGQLALVSLDWGWESNRVVGTNYVAVADLKRRRVCPDTRIPGPFDPAPRVAMRGDTLFVLSQEVVGDAANTVIRTYRIDPSTCNWRRTP